MQSLAVLSIGVGLQDMKDARLRGQGERLRPALLQGGFSALQGSGLGRPHAARVGAVGAQLVQGPRFDPAPQTIMEGDVNVKVPSIIGQMQMALTVQDKTKQQ